MENIYLNIVDGNGDTIQTKQFVPIDSCAPKANIQYTKAIIDDEIENALTRAQQDLLTCSAIDKTLYELTKEEQIILQAFFGLNSHIFRHNWFGGKTTQRHQHIIQVLDSVIKKMPIYKGKRVYRCCHENERQDFETNEIFEPKESLTTSIYKDFNTTDWTTHIFIVDVLPESKTKAHDFRRITKNELKGHLAEGQINFELGSKFKILSTTIRNGKKYIHMKEII